MKYSFPLVQYLKIQPMNTVIHTLSDFKVQLGQFDS